MHDMGPFVYLHRVSLFGPVIGGHLMVVHYYETRIHDEDTEIRRSVTPL